MKVTDFEGGWLYGPKTFAEVTGRSAIWSRVPPVLDVMDGHRPCPLCGATGAPDELFVKGQWDYSRCRTCRMVYTAHAPTPASLDDYYQNGGAPKDWVEHIQGHRVELDLDRRKFRWALRLTDWGPRMSLADIGCSTGTLLEVAKEMAAANTNLSACEPNEDALKIAIDRVTPDFACTNIDALVERGAPHDFVVLWEVLEHVLDPKGLLYEASKIIDEGTVIVCVPNMSSLAARILHEKAPMFGTGHLQMYTPRTLRQSILAVWPEAEVKMYSIISWVKEVKNWLTFRSPFASDDPSVESFFEMNPEWVCDNLYGYKLVAIAKVGGA